MNSDREASDADEYFVTARQIFDYCDAEENGTLRVDTFMEKFTPLDKTNKSKFSYFKALLDPDQSNSEISVSKLATALQRFSETQKPPMDLDESFNSRSGMTPLDSDSGISTDGCQQIEDLQSELREKTHLALQLRSQLDFTDRQHEEAMATLTAERNSLQSQLNMFREENTLLSHVRNDYEDACERLAANENVLNLTQRELDTLKKSAKIMQDDLAALESDKLTLQELLAKSKAECHRINEMYASRQSVLIEENERLKAEHADLSARLQDHDDAMQQIIKKNVRLEMELKDVFNKSNHNDLPMDRSIDISYTDEQALSALDSLTADSRFAPDQTSVSTQVDVACTDCAKREALTSQRSFRRFFWEPIKCLFQIFAVLCFICALSVLYGVTRKVNAPCPREPLPWRWLQPHDLMDLLFRIDYVADVPM